jgi:hypothetical protein
MIKKQYDEDIAALKKQHDDDLAAMQKQLDEHIAKRNIYIVAMKYIAMMKKQYDDDIAKRAQLDAKRERELAALKKIEDGGDACGGKGKGWRSQGGESRGDVGSASPASTLPMKNDQRDLLIL